MNCEQCGKEIKLKLKLEEILVDTLTIKATDAEVEKFRQEFLKSIQKDLTLIISEKKEESEEKERQLSNNETNEQE